MYHFDGPVETGVHKGTFHPEIQRMSHWIKHSLAQVLFSAEVCIGFAADFNTVYILTCRVQFHIHRDSWCKGHFLADGTIEPNAIFDLFVVISLKTSKVQK